MVVLKLDDTIVDDELTLLTKLLAMLDKDLKHINTRIKASFDPDTDGLCDIGEFLVGSGFVAIQRYLTAIHTGFGCNKTSALSMPPHVNEHITYAQALNAGANYWKHSEEWYAEVFQKGEVMDRQAKKTISTIEKLTPCEDYVCANMLSVLLKGEALELSSLINPLITWRNNILGQRDHTSPSLP